MTTVSITDKGSLPFLVARKKSSERDLFSDLVPASYFVYNK